MIELHDSKIGKVEHSGSGLILHFDVFQIIDLKDASSNEFVSLPSRKGRILLQGVTTNGVPSAGYISDGEIICGAERISNLIAPNLELTSCRLILTQDSESSDISAESLRVVVDS